jgi:hypothetical protein
VGATHRRQPLVHPEATPNVLQMYALCCDARDSFDV